MNIFISGIAGFIGSNLCKRLLDEGHVVFGVDNFSHGLKSNIDPFIGNPNFFFETDDLCYYDDMRMSFAPDIVVHLASEKIPRYSDALATIDNNFKMTKNMVEYALQTKARLIFASTSDVYGKNESVPFTEDSELVLGNTDVKRWAYAVSKIHSEHFIIACHDKYGLDYTIARFFSCYGENQANGWWGGVQSVFVENVLCGEGVDIHGSGMQSRCFTYIDDLIDGLMLCVNNKASVNQIFNIGNPSSFCTVFGLYKLIIGMVDRYVPVNYIPYSSLGKYEDSKAKIPNIDKAMRMLGFSPKVNLQDGMAKTINWKRKQLGL